MMNEIPLDKSKLYWNEDEQKYIALSEKEIVLLLTACTHGKVDGVDSCHKVLQWATNIRIGQLLIEGLIDGSLGIQMLDGMEEPVFYNPNLIEDEE